MSNNLEIINFTQLSSEEKEMVLMWRNSQSVKQWMYNDNDIELNDHLAFIESLNNSTDKLYFLVKQSDAYIGVIDFTDIDRVFKSSEFGLYANPDLKGMGKLLLKCICTYGFETLLLDKLVAEAFMENKKAIDLYKQFNFQEIGKKIVNSREVICMELNNEDR